MMNGFDFRPETLGSMCLVWIPIILWTLSLVNSMIMGDIDAGIGTLGIAIGLVVGIFAVSPPIDGMRPLFVLLACSMLIALPITRGWLNRREVRSIDAEAVERAYILLSENPKNFGAKWRLATALYNLGILDHATAIATEALQEAPPHAFAEENSILKRWKQQAEYSPKPPTQIRCIHCGAMNLPGAIRCHRCQEAYLIGHLRGQVMNSDLARKITVIWIVSMMAIAGIPVATTSLPPLLSIVVLVLIISLAALLVIRTFGKPK